MHLVPFNDQSVCGIRLGESVLAPELKTTGHCTVREKKMRCEGTKKEHPNTTV